VLGVGLVVSLGVFALWWSASPFAQHQVLDAARYDAMAREGALVPDRPFHQAPLYPLALGILYRLIGPSALGVGLLQCVVGALLPWLAWRLAYRAASGMRSASPEAPGGTAGLAPRHAARAAAALALLHGPLLLFAPRLLPTVPAIVLQLLVLDRLPPAGETRARAWILPGALLGVCVLLRPNLLLVPVVALGLALAGRLPRRGVAALVATVAVFVAPVTLHNLAHGGGLVLVSANGGETFAHGNHPDARGTYTPVAGLRGTDIFRQEAVSRAIAEEARGHALSAAEVQRYWLGEGLRFIREDPGAYLVLELRKLRLLLGAEEAPDMLSPRLEIRRYLPILAVLAVSLPVLLPLALAGVRVAGRRLGVGWWILLATHAVTLLAFYVSNRYRLPLEALLLIPAGIGLAAIRDRRTWVPLGAGTALAVVLVATTPADRVARAEAQVLTNLGTSLAREGRHEAAVARFEDAIKRHPGWGRAHHYLGRALAVSGRPADAVAPFARAVELDPGEPEPRVDLAAALAATGRGDEARAVLAPVDPPPAELALRVARLHLQLGDAGRALRAVDTSPWSPPVGELRGLARTRTGDLEGARRELEAVVDRTPGATRAWAGLVDVHLRAGDCAGARTRLDEGRRRADDPDALLRAVGAALASACGEGQ